VDDLGLLDATYFQILTVWLSDTEQKILVAPKEKPDPMEMLRQNNGNFIFSVDPDSIFTSCHFFNYS